MNDKILYFSYDPSKFIESLESVTGQIGRLNPNFLREELDRLERERESERWRADPLQVMEKLKSLPIDARYALSGMFFAIARWIEPD